MKITVQVPALGTISPLKGRSIFPMTFTIQEPFFGTIVIDLNRIFLIAHLANLSINHILTLPHLGDKVNSYFKIAR